MAATRAAAAAALPDVLRDIAALATIPGPTGDEHRRAEWVLRRLNGSPGRQSRDDVGNVLWMFGSDDPDVLVMAHLDSVFGKDVELQIRRVDRWLDGPGVGDNACAVAVCISVVGGLVTEHGDLPLAVAFTVGEEGLGNLRGALAACAALSPRRVVAVEGHGLGDTVVYGIGGVRARLRVEGPGGHSWWDRGRPSALHAMVEVVHVLLTAKSRAQVNVGTIEGGAGVNIIADSCAVLLEGRAKDDVSLRQFEELVGALTVEPPLRLSVDVLGRRPAGRLDPDGELVKLVRRTRQELTLPDHLGDGSTDANAALTQGIPAVGIGCAYGSGMHTVHERIDMSSVELGYSQLRLLLEDALVPRSRPPAR